MASFAVSRKASPLPLGRFRLGEEKNTHARIVDECCDKNGLGAQESGNAAGLAVTDPKKDELGWCAQYKTALVEVRILESNCEALLLGKRPNNRIIGSQ